MCVCRCGRQGSVDSGRWIVRVIESETVRVGRREEDWKAGRDAD